MLARLYPCIGRLHLKLEPATRLFDRNDVVCYDAITGVNAYKLRGGSDETDNPPTDVGR